MKSTSWEKSGKWYNKLVGEKGHYYHEHIVLPGVRNLLTLDPKSKLLDIGCGQGVLARHIEPTVGYVGLDLAPTLIQAAKRQNNNPKHIFFVGDATKNYPFEAKDFTHATAILSLQNMENQEKAIQEIGNHLANQGIFVMVLNHPAFRIPRQSGWGTSENKVHYRFINTYMSSQKIPITMHPGQPQSSVTWSFHYPISYYAQALYQAGMVIETMEEWVSDKESVGRAAKQENRSRAEIPLFLAIKARKLYQ